MASFKLTLGRLTQAWKAYPDARSQLRSFPSGPPIFIGGTHRSGTTWFAKMLAEPGLWYIHEPFNPNKRIWQESFTYKPPSQNCEPVNTYFRKLLDGRYRQTANMFDTQHPLMPLRLRRPPIRRVMVKDPLACLLTGYLNHQFEIRTVVLFRHPAGFVSSILRLGWPAGGFLRDFLSRTELMEDHLHPYRYLMEAHQQSNGAEAAAVLHGVLNTVLWNQIQTDSSIAWYQFEHLCEDPLAKFKAVYSQLSLPYTDQTRQRHASLCLHGSPHPDDYHTHAVARNSRAMADSWKHQISPETLNRVRAIWEQFNVPLYKSESLWDQQESRVSEN